MGRSPENESGAGRFDILLDNLYGILTGKIRSDRTDWNNLGNAALFHVDRKTFTGSVKGLPRLTPDQRRQVQAFYAPYVPWVSTRYHRLYTYQAQGRFDPRYIPEDLCFMYIDRFYNDRSKAKTADNKCRYGVMFPDVRQPDTVCMRVDGAWQDGAGKPCTQEEALALAAAEPEVVVKKAVNSECGEGVYFIRGGSPEPFAGLMQSIPCDTILQRPIRQHPAYAALHPESVNSLRIMSLKTGGRIKVLGCFIRFGVGGSRVDNSSSGGIICGVDPETGSLSEYGLYHDGSICTVHPTLGYAFRDMRLPYVDRAYDLVCRAQAHLDDFRLVSWDVAVDESGSAVMVEGNFCLGSINAIQVFNGPLFGDDTDEVLSEVFAAHRKKWDRKQKKA